MGDTDPPTYVSAISPWMDPSNGVLKPEIVATGQTFRLLVFDPPVSGTYRIQANRVSNRDGSTFHLGFSVVEVMP